MTRGRILQPGARIGVFSPSGPPDLKRLQRGIEMLEAWGYRVATYPGHPRPAYLRYLAGPDADRLAELEWALSAPDLDAAWLSRGGYGLTRLLSHLDYDRLRNRPVLGFSDATALLLSLYQRGWTRVFHAPNIQSIAVHLSLASRRDLRSFLTHDAGRPWRLRGAGPDQAAAPLTGGNLCVLASLCGTSEQLVGRGHWVVLEDVGERPYRLDRYLTQLQVAGCLDGVHGFLLGSFTDCGPPRQVEATLRERLEPLGVPVVRGLPVGHGSTNRSFRLGEQARLEAGRLVFGPP